MIRFRVCFFLWIITISITLNGHADQIDEKGTGEVRHIYTLDECIQLALDHHVRQQISRESRHIAVSQRKQVLSAYWPQFRASALYSITDEKPTFIFPESSIELPAEFSTLLSSLGFDMSAIQVPEQHINLMDNQNLAASMQLTLPIYTGGIRTALKKQAVYGIEIAENEMEQTNCEIIRDVKKYYYAVILAGNLLAVAQETFERLNATLDLTEALYKNGSGRVKKTDYLKNKLIVDNVKMMVLELEKNRELARAALQFSMGLPWNEHVKPAEHGIPYKELHDNLELYIDRMLSENLDLQKIALAIRIFDQKVKESKGYLLPHIGLVGQYTRLFNDYRDGMMTPQNKEIWMAGLGINYSFFNGFRFRNKIREDESRLSQLRYQYEFFKKGLTLLVQTHFRQLITAQHGIEIAKNVHKTSLENLDLVKKAYQIEVLTEKDLIEAQIIEALMRARLEKSFYDHYQMRADLEFILAEQVADFTKRHSLENN